MEHLVNPSDYVSWNTFAYVVGGLVVAICAMAIYIKHLHKSGEDRVSNLYKTHSEKQEKNLELLVGESSKNRLVIERNTQLFERTFDYITKK